MKARKILAAIIVALALVAGCAAGQGGGLFGRKNKVDSERKAKLTERVRLLDIDWEILIKDDPALAETIGFRGNMADASRSLAADDLDAAEKAVAAAETWMTAARPRFYREHESRVMAGASEETSEQLMAAALAFKQKGEQAQAAGDQAAAQKYLAAAVEEGELAIASAGRSSQTSDSLTRLIEQMGAIYAAAGRPDQSSELKARLVRSLQASLDATAKQIELRLRNGAPGFSEAELKKDKAAVEKAVKELNGLNDQYRRQAADANAFAPGEVKSNEYGMPIATWTARWIKVHEPQNPDGPEPPPPEDPGPCITALALHNQIKKDAQSIQGSGIVIEETSIAVEGSQVVIRGKLQNLRNQPILNPRITVTGGVMSKVVDLGYDRMNPPHSTTFILPLECFTVEAYNRSMNKVPDHQIVLIFREPNGTERKVIQSMGVRAGN